MDERYVLVVGDPFDEGLCVYGPFETYDEAETEGKKWTVDRFWVVDLYPPKKG